MDYDIDLEHRVRVAVSALNISRGAYAGAWHLYTPEDVERNVSRIEQLMEETRENITDLERVYVELLQVARRNRRESAAAKS